MPSFSQRSKDKLATCHPLLQDLFNEVIRHIDCKVECGQRGKAEQDRLHRLKRSKVVYPHSKHNKTPSFAADVVPYPVIWPDKKNRPDSYVLDMGRFYMFAGYVKATADQLEITIRLGADWDSDFQVSDQTFHDLPHFELIT